MPDVTVALGSDGQPAFAVSWTEPMRAEFSSRRDAEQFAAWLSAIGCTVEVDGSCGPCSAHHASGHDCPACGANLGMRVAPILRRLSRPTPVGPDQFLIVREQHRIRIEIAAQARADRLAELYGLVESDRVVDAIAAIG